MIRRLAGVLLALTVALVACSSDEATLPAIELERLGGGTLDLAAATGEPRVLNLWATWCAPCRAELPAFDRVAASSPNIEIVGINIGDSAEAASELVEELGLSFPQALDPDAEVQVGLKITGMPATIFLDPDGDLIEIHNGELEEDELRALLDEHY